jgi:hypothetical protein
MRHLYVLAIALVGCSGGGSGGGGGGGSTVFTSSVNGSQSIGSLTPSQQTQLCNDITTFAVRALEPSVCKLSGLAAAEFAVAVNTAATNADLQTACTSAQNTCEAEAGAPSQNTGTTTCDFSGVNATNCTATVADFSACLTDVTSAVNQEFASLPSCSTVTTQNVASLSSFDAGTPANPTSCNTLDAKCPGAMTSAGVSGH